MKYLVLSGTLALVMALAGSCKKALDHKQKSGKNTLRVDGVSMYHGIPRYSTEDVYHDIYDQLQTNYLDNLTELEELYLPDRDLSPTEYQSLAWEVWEKTKEPLTDFESSISLSNSYRNYKDNNYKIWLSSQGEELDESSFPQGMPLDPVQASMINADGDFMVGNSIYHMMPFNEGIGVIQIIDGEVDIDILDTISMIPMTSLMDRLQNWRNNNVSFFEIPIGDPSDPNRCRANLVYQKWINVDDNTKYLAQHAFYYDLLKTSGTIDLEAAARINLFLVKVWVPALTNTRIAMQRFEYHSECDSFRSQYIEGSTLWGPRNIMQNNWWTKKGKIKKPASNSSGPTDGFWSRTWVKNMDHGGVWTGLTW